MMQSRPAPRPAGGAAVLGVIAAGAAAAVVVGTIVHVVLNFLVGGNLPGLEDSKLIAKILFAGGSLLTGLIVGGAVMMTRPAGPLAPITAAVAAVVAGQLASAFGFLLWHLLQFSDLPFRGEFGTIISFLFKVHGAWGYTLLLLPALSAGAVAALRVLKPPTPAPRPPAWSGPGPFDPGGPPQDTAPNPQQHGDSGAPPYPGAPGQPPYGAPPRPPGPYQG